MTVKRGSSISTGPGLLQRSSSSKSILTDPFVVPGKDSDLNLIAAAHGNLLEESEACAAQCNPRLVPVVRLEDAPRENGVGVVQPCEVAVRGQGCSRRRKAIKYSSA